MSSNYPQNFLSSVLAASGDFTIPPVTAASAGSGKFSQQNGFPPETSQPLSQGGFPPDRRDFNGVLNLLSQFIVWYQQGGLLNYSTEFNYEPGNELLFNGAKYRCLKENGPGSSTVTPGTDLSTWLPVDETVATFPQTLTPTQQTQARENIDCPSSADLSDLSQQVSNVVEEVNEKINTLNVGFGNWVSNAPSTGTASSDGIFVIISQSNTTVSISVNGILRAQTARRDKYGQGQTSITCPIGKGSSYVISGAQTISFLPLGAN